MSSKNGNNLPSAVAPQVTARRRRRRWPLSLTLTVWYASACFSIVCLTAGLMYFGLASSLDHDHDQFLVGKAQDLKQLLLSRPGHMKALREEVDEAWVSVQYARVCARVVNAHDKTLVESSQMGPGLSKQAFAIVPVTDELAPVGKTIYSPTGKPYRALVIHCDAGPVLGRLRIQTALEAYGPSSLLASFRRRLYWVLGVLLVISCGVGHLIARRGLRPLSDVTEQTRRIGSATLDKRLDVAACPAEVADLASTFNGMLDRLQEAFDRLARFSADIAHELRTPVNNLRVQIEVTLQRGRSEAEYRHALASSLEEGLRLSRIIDCLLFLARAEDPSTQVKREMVELRQELERLRDFYDALASEHGLRLTVQCDAVEPLWVDRVLFQRAVGNLLENSVAHTGSGGRVELRACDTPGGTLVEVIDSGSGIPTEHLARVTDRFYRADRSRTSGGGGRVGLGLSIVKSIMMLHGGTLAVESRPAQGTRVLLTFPKAAVPAATVACRST